MHKTLYTILKDRQVLMTLKLEIPILKPRDKTGAEVGGSPKAVSQHDLTQWGLQSEILGDAVEKNIGPFDTVH